METSIQNLAELQKGVIFMSEQVDKPNHNVWHYFSGGSKELIAQISPSYNVLPNSQSIQIIHW